MPLYERRVRILLRRFADDKASEDEIKEMLGLLHREEGDRILESFITEMRHETNHSTEHENVDWDNLWNKIHQSAIQPRASVLSLKWVYRAAAIILIAGLGAFYLNSNSKKKDVATQPVQVVTNDVSPGSNKAILTLANGSQIVLEDASSGQLAQQGNSQVIKGANGELIYKATGAPVQEVLYNTVSTQRGGEYKLILPDGSAVWLNALSSIRYPTAFVGNERLVEITGEAYFEVTENKTRPFRVMVNSQTGNRDMEVTVLGTHFNINAYTDELTTKTTLLNGSVKVTKGTSSAILKPGQQTELNDIGKIRVINDVNVYEAVAWKEGRFEFNDTDLKTILRQVMRWYDVQVEYQSDIPDRYFTATISRHKTLSGLLNILRQSDVDIELEGQKLTVRR
jgi:ferric-dicitrate binding protein FerR (iron transport regulator)